MIKKCRVAVAISGGGRSLENLIKKSSDYGSYDVIAVISSRSDCGGVSVAERANLPILVEQFTNSPMVERRVNEFLVKNRVDFIVLAGFLKKFPIVSAPVRPVINIHPALLPSFGGPGMYGRRVHEAVRASGVSESGATIHYVTENYDEGPIIAQVVVAIDDCDSADDIAKRVFDAECDIYPKVLDGIARNQLPIANGQSWKYRYS